MRDDNMGQISKLRDLGVKIIAGTDAGWRFTKFGSLAVEAWLLTEAGMTAREAVAACTGQSARVLGIGEETGSVTEGLTADIVAVVGDPTADLRQLAGVRMVMQTGSVRVTDGRLVRADSDKVLPIMV